MFIHLKAQDYLNIITNLDNTLHLVTSDFLVLFLKMSNVCIRELLSKYIVISLLLGTVLKWLLNLAFVFFFNRCGSSISDASSRCQSEGCGPVQTDPRTS
jgi:hypothetical protein